MNAKLPDRSPPASLGGSDAAPTSEVVTLALSVARCPEVPRARVMSDHPCRRIVSSQPGDDPQQWQVPEPWAGGLWTAKVLFLSSNPSISVAPPGQPDRAEDYPTASRPDDGIASFLTHRFDHWATRDGRFRRLDGEWSEPVPFWNRVQRLASEILDKNAKPAADYVMTEVVHCKSRSEFGVAEAVDHCANLHLNRILTACPARLIVVLGAKGRDQVRDRWGLADRFGRGERPGNEEDHQDVVHLAGKDRMVLHLPHPTGMEPVRSALAAFPNSLPSIRTWAGAAEPARDSLTRTVPELAAPSRPVTHPRALDPQIIRSMSVSSPDVAIVAAGNAWPFYRLTGAYVCQARRTFRNVRHLGFYSQRTIHGAIAAIEHIQDGVLLSQAEAARLALSLDPLEQRLGNVIAAALAAAWHEGERSKVMLLTTLDDPRTTTFPPIRHLGRAAWVMSQRYTSLDALQTAITTDDLTESAA